MASETYRFCDLNTLIENVHALFDKWEAEETFQPQLDVNALQQMKLAVHEWLANLVQHADFENRQPSIAIEVRPNGERVWCEIEDNSRGFILDEQLVECQNVLEAFPDRGMGLLMIDACTEDLSYHRVDADRHRLQFSISADQDPWVNIPF